MVRCRQRGEVSATVERKEEGRKKEGRKQRKGGFVLKRKQMFSSAWALTDASDLRIRSHQAVPIKPGSLGPRVGAWRFHGTTP